MSLFSISRVESLATVDDDSYLSPRSLATSDNFPWSPDHVYATILQQSPDAGTHVPAGTRSLSTSARSSDPPDAGHYFSSTESQYSQSSVDEDSALRSACPGTGTSRKYPVKSKDGVCGLQVVPRNDPEIMRTSPKRTCDGRRASSGLLNKDKPLPLLPPVDTASPFSEIAYPRARLSARPVMRQSSQQRGASSQASRTKNSPPERTLMLSNKYRSKAPKLFKLSSGKKLDAARTFHARDTKNHSIVRHELPTSSNHPGEQAFDSGNTSPISKLIFDLESFPWAAPQLSGDEGRPVPCSSVAASNRCMERSTGTAAHSKGYLGDDSAELIILNILSHLEIHDLFSAARISRGFYTVLKKQELLLIKNAIFNTSPAAWEYLERSCKSLNVPKRYVELYKNGMETISTLRSSILIRCDAILRQETISGLVCADKEKSKNIDQAFWRIWTFCTVFSHNSGQQKNAHTQAQLDWLKGSRASSARASKLPILNHSQPLSSAELLDISEIWNCLANLLKGFYKHIGEAQDAGLFDRRTTDDTYTEEFYMNQWIDHIMTFGLSTIVELLCCSSEDVTASGWLQWSPTANTDEKPTFLSDAVALAYQHRLIEEAEVEALKVTVPRKASARARHARKRYSATADTPRTQNHIIRRKVIGSPAKKRSITQLYPISTAQRSHHDSCSPIQENPRLGSIAEAPQRTAAASSVTTANRLQELRLHSGVSTQIGPTLFTSIRPSARSSSSAISSAPARSSSSAISSSSPISSASARSWSASTAPQSVSPLSSVQSMPIAISRPQRVPPRATHLARSTEQPDWEAGARFAPLSQSDRDIVSPVGDYVDRAIGLLVNEMGFPMAAVKDALESCGTESHFKFDTVVAMLVSASRKPAITPTPRPAVTFPQPSELDSSPVQPRPYPQLQMRTASQRTKRLGGRRRDQKDAQRRRVRIGFDSIDRVGHRGWSFAMPSVVLRALSAGYAGDV